MKRTCLALGFVVLAGALSAQPPRGEEEDPNAKKNPPPIDINSFPDPKDSKNPINKTKPAQPSGNDGPGVPPGKGMLVVGVRQLPVRMSPSQARTDADRWALDLLFEGLMRPVAMDSGFVMAPALSAGPPRAELGGRGFSIDPGATWSDANHSPVTANDVIASLNRLRTAGGDVPADAFSDARLRLRLTFGKPHPDPVALCTFKVLPSAASDDEAFARQPIGSGPYVYSGQVVEGRRDYAVFKANPYYAQRVGRNNRPLLREVRFLMGSEPLADFRRGIVDIVLEESTLALAAAAPPADRIDDANARLESGLGGDAKMVTRPTRRIYYLAINPIKTALAGEAGKNLRRAIAMGIDRERTLNEVWRQPGQPFHHALTGPFPSGTWACDPAAGPLDDEVLGKAELKLAKPPREKLLLVFPSEQPLAASAASLIAEQLSRFGVPTAAKGLPDAEFRKVVIGDKAYDLAWRHFDYRDDWFDPGLLFSAEHGGLAGSQRLEDALNRCLNRCEFSSLRSARRQLHREFRDIMPFVPLWSPDVHVVMRRTVEPAPAADQLDPLQPFVEIERWRVNR